MVCYNPIPACYNKKEYVKTGKKSIHLVMHEKEKGDSKWLLNEKYFPHSAYEYIYLPCRKCAGCRSDNARMWMLRAYNEMILHKKNCFITLTYADESPLVKDDPLCLVSLRYKHFQNFIKRLRKKFEYPKLKYLMCGEYGPASGRAHWHCILFNFDFDDKKLVYVSKGYNHYSSQKLNELWSVYDRKNDMYVPIGFTDLAECDIDCCSYVSQYVLKKLDIDESPVYVDSFINDETGKLEHIELADRCPPMVRSSRNPAIGLDWFNKYGDDCVRNGHIYIPSGNSFTKIKTPAYYELKFSEKYPKEYSIIKECKEKKIREFYRINKPDFAKLRVWCESHLHRIKKAIKQKIDIKY